MQIIFFFIWPNSPQWARAPSFTRFLDHTQRRTTVGMTPLDEWSALRIDLYLTKHNTQQRDIHAHGRIRNHNPSKTAAADTRRSPSGHYNRQLLLPSQIIWKTKFIHMYTKASLLYLCNPAHDPLRSIFCYPRTMRTLSKLFLFYHLPPPPSVLSSPYMSRPSFTTWVHHTYV